MYNLSAIRMAGNTLMVLGYFAMLHVDMGAGLITKISGALMVSFGFYKLKMYDVIAMLSIFIALDLSKLFTLLG